MKLNEEQIQSLFVFTQKKFVHWYDLQTELVDHLASGIEYETEKDPSLTFDKALQKVYTGFGVMGFSRIIQEKQSQLTRSAERMWMKELKDIFSWPRILMVCLIAAVMWTLTLFITEEFLFATFTIIYISIGLIFFIYVIKDYKAKSKILLLQCGSGTVLPYFIFFEIISASAFMYMDPVVFTIVCTIGIIMKYISFLVYRRINQKAVELYPAIFSSAK